MIFSTSVTCSLQFILENVDNIEEVPVDKKTLGHYFTISVLPSVAMRI